MIEEDKTLEELSNPNMNIKEGTQYYFRRTLFKMDDQHCVELVALASESNNITENHLEQDCDVIATDSREIPLTDLHIDLGNYLNKHEVKKEVIEISSEQLKELHRIYGSYLFLINESVINQLN